MNYSSRAGSILQLLSSPEWTHLVYALLHSLWLGAVWLGVMGLCLKAVGRDPQRRYAAGLACLAGLVLTTFLAWAALERTAREFSRAPSSPLVQAVPFHPSVVREAARSEVSFPAPSRIERKLAVPVRPSWISWLAVAWLAGSFLMVVRMLADLLEVRRVRRGCPAVIAPSVSHIVEEVGGALGLRRLPEVLESARGAVPAVAGFLRPVVLLPMSLLTGASEAELRAVLAHELAHIRRHDYLVNLVQRLVESLLFFNPAVWWINRQIRQEREACCDALAAKLVGGPGDYVEALAVWAERLPLEASRVGVPFPGDRRPSSLLDRVRRLLTPGYQPAMRLPWSSLVAVLLLSGAVLGGIWRTSNLVVSMAAEILAPQPRVERVAKIQARTAPPERDYGEEDKIVIEGRLRTWDGAPLPEGVEVHVKSDRPGSSVGVGPISVSQGHFVQRVEYGRILVAGVVRDGYGPAFLGPLEAKPGGSISNIDLVLPRGFATALRVVDPEGKPVPNAGLRGTYQNQAGWIELNHTTDADGLARITNCVDTPMDWEVDAAGFASERRVLNFRFAENKSSDWPLRRTRSTWGQVVGKVSGEPVGNAVLRAIYRGPSAGGAIEGELEKAPVVARTDPQGRFRLASLAEDSDQILLVEAPGRQRKLVAGMKAGRETVRVELGPEVFIAGEVQGDLSLLDSRSGPVVWVENPLPAPRMGDYFPRQPVAVSVRDGVGRFVATNLLEGNVRLTAGGTVVTVGLGSKPLTNIVIRLDGVPKVTGEAEREVVFRFSGVEKGFNISGTLHVGTWSPNDKVTRSHALPILNGEARMVVKVRDYISWETRGLFGAWIPDELSPRVVPPGEDPMVVDLKTIPAGAIHASVRNADGSETDGVLIEAEELAPSPERPIRVTSSDLGRDGSRSYDDPTRFVAHPLPLGGEHRLTARRGSQFAISPSIQLTKEKPTAEVELRFALGRKLQAQMTDPQGRPVSGVAARLWYSSTPWGRGYRTEASRKTDDEGLVAWEGVNDELPGTYAVLVDHAPGWQATQETVDFGSQPVRVVLKPGLRITGKVLREGSGNPLGRVELFAMVRDSNGEEGLRYLDADTVTDEEGRYVFSTLAGRDYWIISRSGALTWPSTGIVRVTAGVTEKLDLHLEPFVIRVKPGKGIELSELGRVLKVQ